MRLKNILFTLTFIVCIYLFPLSFYVLNEIAVVNGKTLDIDIGEKREKIDFNKDDSIDNLGKNIEKYYNDRIPYRNYLIIADRMVNGFINSTKESKVNKKNEIIEADETNETNETTDANIEKELEIDPYVDNYPLICSNNNMVIFGQSNWMFLNRYPLMEIFKNEDLKDEAYIKEVCNEIIEIDKISKQKGVQIYYLIAPDKQEVYEEYMPYIDRQNEKLNFPEKIVKFVNDNAKINIIYPRELLKSYKNKYRMYKKYDSHWNQLSAYLATNEIYKQMHMNLPDINELTINKIEEAGWSNELFLPSCRDLILLANINYEDYPIAYEYDIIYNGIDNKYKDKNLCIIGDSFSVDMINKVLQKDFTNIGFIHGVDELPKGKKLENIKNFDIIIYEIVERNIADSFLVDLQNIRKSLWNKK